MWTCSTADREADPDVVCKQLGRSAPALTRNASYEGADEVSYEVRSASGKVESHTVRITVKDTQAPDAKADQDAEL
jgi:hypothetical protein